MMKMVYNVVTFLAAVIVLGWASWETYLHVGFYTKAAATCPCDCGCKETGTCKCGAKCPCDCGCGKTGTCACGTTKDK